MVPGKLTLQLQIVPFSSSKLYCVHSSKDDGKIEMNLLITHDVFMTWLHLKLRAHHVVEHGTHILTGRWCWLVFRPKSPDMDEFDWNHLLLLSKTTKESITVARNNIVETVHHLQRLRHQVVKYHSHTSY